MMLSPLMLNGFSTRAFATPKMMSMCDGISDRVLVVIQLAGANDGINMLLPINQYSDLQTYRSNIIVPETGTGGYLTLDSSLPDSQQLGLHPSMTAFKDLYDAGKANIIQAVGYENQNRSHFKATDLWLTGGDGTPENNNIDTGWMGRYLDYTFPGIAGNPSEIMLDPLGIELGDGETSIGFSSTNINSPAINLAQQNASELYDLVSSVGILPPFNIPDSDYGDELEFLLNVQNNTSVYAQRISEVFDAGSNAVTYPEFNLAYQLQTVARLISGGCKTKIFLVNLGGFDTHAGQVVPGDTHTGTHANLLEELAESVKAFQDDLAALGIEDRVLSFTFSEFGRKVVENGSLGTDHGTLVPMLMFGSAIESGVFGTNPNINNIDSLGAIDQSERQFDYRQLYTTVLQDWLGASDSAVAATMFDDYLTQKIAVVNSANVVSSECYINQVVTPSVLLKLETRLQGAYDASTGLMRTDLLTAGIIPLMQPFGIAPWNYAGTESVASINDLPANTVDWVLVEVRNGADGENIVAQRAALLLDDGSIVDADDLTGVRFFNLITDNDYYVAIRARNHLAVLSSETHQLPNAITINLSSPTEVMEGASQLVSLGGGLFAQFCGDYNNDGLITVEDYNRYIEEASASSINMYVAADGNMDANVTVSDFNLYQPNASIIGVQQIRY